LYPPKNVEILWTTRAKPVEKRTTKFIFGHEASNPMRGGMWTGPSCVASLDRTDLQNRIVRARNSKPDITNVKIHHFEQTIGGREYQIEVTRVSNRWRAQLRRGPGMPTAMMPFYGPTPDEAAHHLLQWLSLAHERFAAASAAISPPRMSRL
jgi:hypothetical protein